MKGTVYLTNPEAMEAVMTDLKSRMPESTPEELAAFGSGVYVGLVLAEAGARAACEVLDVAIRGAK